MHVNIFIFLLQKAFPCACLPFSWWNQTFFILFYARNIKVKLFSMFPLCTRRVKSWDRKNKAEVAAAAEKYCMWIEHKNLYNKTNVCISQINKLCTTQREIWMMELKWEEVKATAKKIFSYLNFQYFLLQSAAANFSI